MNKQHVSILLYVFLAPAVCRSGHADERQSDFRVSATFSIVAVDPETGVCGAAVASKYPGVGRIVPYVRADVGAFCTQHWHNPEWGEEALDLLAAEHGSEEVLGILLKDDERRDKRQLAIIDMQGRAANRNPANADPSGIYWAAMSGRFYACQGNTLTGRQVIVAMAKAYEETAGSLTDRLVAALVAADCVGGDHRGRLAAGIRVARTGREGHWFELYVDESDDAVIDLLKKYVAIEHSAKGDWTRGPFTHPCPRHKAVPQSEPSPSMEAVSASNVAKTYRRQDQEYSPCDKRRPACRIWHAFHQRRPKRIQTRPAN